MMTARRFLPLPVILLGAAILYLIGMALYARAAHAAGDSTAAASPAPPLDLTTVAAWIGGALSVAIAALHFLVQVTHSARLARLELIAEQVAGLPATPPKLVPPSVGGAAALLALVVLGASALTLGAGCSSARPRAAAGLTAAIDCEAPAIAAVLPDLVPLVEQALQRAITGAGTIDTAQLRADAAPIKSDLGRCALAAAVAILATPVPVTPAVASAAPRAPVDGAQLRAAFAGVRGDLGWPSVRLSGGEVL